MKNRLVSNIYRLLFSTLIMCVCITTLVVCNVTVTYAEDIIHTHIWATKYDDKNHWEYCTVCNKVQNKKEHKCVDHWFMGSESCRYYNYSNRICECGYNYVYKKPHAETSEWKQYASRLLHYNMCKSCNTWLKTERCIKDGKYTSCINPGKCDKCGAVSTKNNHFIVEGGKCRDCGKKILEISDYKLVYSDEYSMATITFSIKPLVSDASLTGKMSGYTGNPNYTSVTWNSDKKSDGSVEYKGTYKLDSSKQRKCTVKMGDIKSALKISGEEVYINASLFEFTIWQDHREPEIEEIQQKNQKTCGEWATIKELTITGKEKLSKLVTISIIDKETKDIIVNKAQTEVKNGKFTYKCTPPLEGPVEGRSYILQVSDEIGNLKEKEFKVYRTDCRAPIIRSEKEYTQWSKTKNIVFKLTDYGAGQAYTSLLDQVNYIKSAVVDGGFNAAYTFSTENYGIIEYKLYVKDGLGNAALETIKVGKVDNTKPTIKDIKSFYRYDENVANTNESEEALTNVDPIGAVIRVEANDKNIKLNAEGSGVCGYALIGSKEKIKDEEWQEYNSITISTPGKYYLWVKDTAGNIADLKAVTVKDDFSIVLGEEVEVEDSNIYNDGDIDSSVVVSDTDGEDDDEDDITPSTGDSSFVVAALIMLIVSGLMGIVILKKKNRKMI